MCILRCYQSGVRTLHLPLGTTSASWLIAKDNDEPIHFPIQLSYRVCHNSTKWLCRAVQRACAQQKQLLVFSSCQYAMSKVLIHVNKIWNAKNPENITALIITEQAACVCVICATQPKQCTQTNQQTDIPQSAIWQSILKLLSGSCFGDPSTHPASLSALDICCSGL